LNLKGFYIKISDFICVVKENGPIKNGPCTYDRYMGRESLKKVYSLKSGDTALKSSWGKKDYALTTFAAWGPLAP